MYTSKTYRSPYPCYRPNQVPAVATTAGTTTLADQSFSEGRTHTNALCATLSDNALYLIGLISLLKDLVGPQGMKETLMPVPVKRKRNQKNETKNAKP